MSGAAFRILTVLALLPEGMAVTPLMALLELTREQVQASLFQLLERNAIERYRHESGWHSYRIIQKPCPFCGNSERSEQVAVMSEGVVLAHDHEQGAFMLQSGGETWRAVSGGQGGDT